ATNRPAQTFAGEIACSESWRMPPPAPAVASALAEGSSDDVIAREIGENLLSDEQQNQSTQNERAEVITSRSNLILLILIGEMKSDLDRVESRPQVGWVDRREIALFGIDVEGPATKVNFALRRFGPCFVNSHVVSFAGRMSLDDRSAERCQKRWTI